MVILMLFVTDYFLNVIILKETCWIKLGVIALSQHVEELLTFAFFFFFYTNDMTVEIISNASLTF